MRLGGPRRRLTTLGTLDHSLLILLDPDGETELEENDDYGGTAALQHPVGTAKLGNLLPMVTSGEQIDCGSCTLTLTSS